MASWRYSCGLLAATALAGVTPGASSAPMKRDWGATLQADAQALHDDIAANHPGPVNPDDPGFARRNNRQLERALNRSRTARSYGDYYFALREYVASFDDGHFSFGATGATPNTDRWPGFLTEYDGVSRIRVFTRADDAPVPIGAELESCDGRPAARFATDTLGRSWGRWQLESQHLELGRFLFIDQGNRYVRMPRRCIFRVDGRRRPVAIAWRDISFQDLSARLFGERRDQRRSFGARTLNDGTRWYALPSFDGDPRSEAGKALPGLIAAMRADRAALAAAPAVVLDVRGNGGGSSDWSDQIAAVLWGRDAVDRRPQRKMRIYWRASAANLKTLEDGYGERRAGASPAVTRFFESAIAGLKGAIGRGEPLWEHRDDEDAPAPRSASAPAETIPPPIKRVYVVTDAHCASACLDALDLWRAMGAVQVGRTTSADTLYMEVRRYRLPSGLTSGGMPMKVYRGRARGNNEPLVPADRFDGDIGDTPALERWIATLPAR